LLCRLHLVCWVERHPEYVVKPRLGGEKVRIDVSAKFSKVEDLKKGKRLGEMVHFK
jgi:hypothetical protein